MAQEVGIEGVMKIIGNTFGKVTFKRKDKVVTLASINSSIKVAKKRVDIDPLTIFQRVCITKQSDEDLKEHFKYELAPFPMSLFNEEGMRKGTKSSFYSAFTPLSSNITLDTNTFVVVDGGYLLHKVVWHYNNNIRTIVTYYVIYLKKHFGNNVAVVFDGYPVEAAHKNTKSAERMRRSAIQSCSDIIFDESTLIQVPQEKLLANDNNKRRFIALLRIAFEQQGIEVKEAEEDADRDIVTTALSKSTDFKNVIIIGEDVDLLVLLISLGSHVKNVYLQKSGRGESGCVNFSSSSYTHGSTQYPQGIVLFCTHSAGATLPQLLSGKEKQNYAVIFKKIPTLSKCG